MRSGSVDLRRRSEVQASFFTRGELFFIQHSCRRNSCKRQDAHCFPKKILPKLDVGHLHILHRQKVPPSHLTLILRYPVTQEFLGEDDKQTSLPMSRCLQVHSEFLTRNFLTSLTQRSIWELHVRADKAIFFFKSLLWERICMYMSDSCYLTSAVRRWELDAFFSPVIPNVYSQYCPCFSFLSLFNETTCLRKRQLLKYTLTIGSVSLLDHEIHFGFFQLI